MNNVFDELIINAGDIDYRRRLNGTTYKRIFDFVIVELKRYIANRLNRQYISKDYLIHSGRIYTTCWLRTTNSRVKDKTFTALRANGIYSIHYQLHRDIVLKYYPLIEKWYADNVPNSGDMNDNQRLDAIRANGSKLELSLREYLEDYNRKKDVEDGFVFKARRLVKTMDYSVVNIYQHHASQIKFYKANKTTSNKGMEAVSVWSYSDGSRSGWTLSGLKAGCIERFCLENGLKKKDCKKWKYGDYADWILKTLE
jgi:hypothetical protein